MTTNTVRVQVNLASSSGSSSSNPQIISLESLEYSYVGMIS